MSTSTRIHILLPDDTLSRLDMKRGLVPRSSYIRDLVERALMMDGRPELMEETPAKKVTVVPVGQNQTVVDHHHVWERNGMFDRCTKCDERKRH